MEYILNKSPIWTTNNFKVNDFKIDLDIVETKFKDFKYKNLDIKIEFRNNLESKVGLPASKYLYVDVKGNENTGYLEYDFNNDYLASLIHVNASDLVIAFKGDNALLNTKIVIDNDVNSNISIINLTSKESKSFISIENIVNNNIKSIVNFIELGGKVKVSNYYSINNGENYFNSLYLGKENEKIDMNYYIGLNKNSIGNINVEGSLMDGSYKSFKGIIDFYKGSSKSIGKENENCILLSDECISKSLPILLCHEEDVEGSHSVSAGKIDDEKLFYIMSRGINEKDAKKMIINANYNKIIDNINDEDIKEVVRKKINEEI